MVQLYGREATALFWAIVHSGHASARSSAEDSKVSKRAHLLQAHDGDVFLQPLAMCVFTELISEDATVKAQ